LVIVGEANLGHEGEGIEDGLGQVFGGDTGIAGVNEVMVEVDKADEYLPLL